MRLISHSFQTLVLKIKFVDTIKSDMAQSDFNVSIDEELYNGDYSEIKNELKGILTEIGLRFGWKLNYSDSNNIVFTTPPSLTLSGETVTVYFETRKIFQAPRKPKTVI